MQQTETYKLKLIDTDDEFSPKALNENAKTLEKELARVDAALDAKADQTALARVDAALGTKAEQPALAALSGQVAALDMNRLRFKYGSYIGTGENGKDHPNHLEFGFKPLMVVIGRSDKHLENVLWTLDRTCVISVLNSNPNASPDYVFVTWTENGISWYSVNSAYAQLNAKSTYCYFVVGVKV